MIALTGESLSLLSAAFARVSKNENHSFPADDLALKEISEAIGAECFSVYDLGGYKNKTRYIRFDFPIGQIELQIGPQPVLVNTDNRPEGDDMPPGTPIAFAVAA